VKLKSAVFHEALKAAFKQLGISANYAATSSFTQFGTAATFSASAIKASFKTGEFLITSEFLDSLTSTTDNAVLGMFKNFTDNTGAAEDATLAFFKVLADNGFTTDQHVLDFFKSLSDDANVLDTPAKTFGTGFSDGTTITEEAFLGLDKTTADAYSVADQLNDKGFGKGASEVPTAADEVNTFALTKALFDQATVTDDLDGEATTQDDQEMQFAKVTTQIASAIDVIAIATAYTRTFSDNYGVTDSNILTPGKRPSDTLSMTDVGSLRSQGFSDFTYFAEDYVGASRTFT
tara:strand:- start:741 stop:1613 length:873 start_codon:yes stop_codon:yes gene_type:complete